MIHSIKICLGLFLLVILAACNPASVSHHNNTASDSTIYPKDLNPSMFATRNITSSDLQKFLPYSNFDYSDTLHGKVYQTFDSMQDTKYLQSLMPAVGLAFFQTVRLVSWQDKIGDLQPYIVRVDGEDYDGTEYVVLDKNYKPVSEVTISGGWSVNDDDSAGYMIHYLTRATFIKNEITLTKLNIHLWVGDSVKRPCLVDSMTYRIQIMTDGTLNTTMTDSTRYKQKSDAEFYEY